MDVAVVGAGPAGSFCAWRLARAGQRVTLYDPSHPREKPCGGGVTPGAFARWPELDELRAAARPSHAVRMIAPHGGQVSIALAQPIEIFSRRVLDSLLLEKARKAGAELRAARVRRVSSDADGVTLELESERARHDFVVGADGASSAVRRSLLGERPGGGASYATAGFHVAGLAERDLVVEFTPDFAGYLWVFPRPGHASVGIAAPLGHANGAELRARVLDFLARRYPGSESLAREPYAASIPVGSGPVAGPRFALVGDAANANDAITGEGIQHALDSGGMLADALSETGVAGAPALYTERWQAGPGGELDACARLARRLYRPRAVDLSVALALRSRRARRLMADMLIAAQPYRGLGRRMLGDALRRPRE
jgi:geranylgeranyl reductase family protein